MKPNELESEIEADNELNIGNAVVVVIVVVGPDRNAEQHPVTINKH